MKCKILPREDAACAAADQVCRVIEQKPDAVLLLGAGEGCLLLYAALARRAARGEVSLRHARVFSLCELSSLEAGDPRSCRARLTGALGALVEEQNRHFLSDENLAEYDSLLSGAGGIDLAVLDVGTNARLGFNEIATPYASQTHRQKLSPATRRELEPLFGGEAPVHGLTAGIGTICSAREILALAFGAERAQAVYKTLYARNDSVVPAAFLQLPAAVTLIVDEAAAQTL